MSRQSPPTERVVRLLETLIEHSSERFSVSELARRADLSKPTCIGICRALTDAGYLDRDPETKTYGLGPALIRAGRAAVEGLAPITLVNDGLAILSEGLQLPVTAAAFRGDQLTIIGRAGPPSIYDPVIQVGTRLSMTPPTGKLAHVFASDVELQKWLDREPTAHDSDERERLWKVFGEAHRTGYLVSRETKGSEFFITLLERLNRRDVSDDVATMMSELASEVGSDEYIEDELKPGGSYPVSTVSAPTYDANGSVKLLFVVYVANDNVRYSDIHHYGETVRAVGRELTEAIGGIPPKI